jgi:CheY-like chemotaxis protein
VKTALIVDDSPYNRTLLSAILTRKRFKIETAEDGVAGFEKFSRCNPDVVFLDFIMPKMNGVELLAKIKSVNPGVIAIMITSISASDDVEKAKIAGANAYILKPYATDKVYETLEKFHLLEPEGPAA